MKEARFIKLRKKRWEELEAIVKNRSKKEPDELAEMYIELSDDLAYSQTFYPKSKTTSFLNELALFFHRRIYRNKREDRGRFLRFWLEEIPETMYRARFAMLAALLIFLVAILLGIVSMRFNPDFARIILGDAYVDLTLSNIKNQDPMAIYAGERQDLMFLGITLNNIKVSFLAFLFGLLSPLGSAGFLLKNGIMLGCFQYFFYQEGVLGLSAQAIWVHGTIEITSIVVAGGAGIYMSSGFLFPGTYSRIARFRKTAKDGLKIIIGLIPFFIVAGFLESFVTRFYKISALSLPCIILSLGFVFWYFVYLPYMKHRYESRTSQAGTV
ncbi:MAG: stage II sporulation protein M [Bacteroidia bacterium]